MTDDMSGGVSDGGGVSAAVRALLSRHA
jgi:hypothetical protein